MLRRLVALSLLVSLACAPAFAQAASASPRAVFQQMVLDEDRAGFLRHVSPAARAQFAEFGLGRWLEEPLVHPGERHHVQVFASGPMLAHWATPGVPERKLSYSEKSAMNTATVTLSWNRFDLRESGENSDLHIRFDLKREAGAWVIAALEPSADMQRQLAALQQPAPAAGPQTPRQALLAMFFSDDKATFLRHLPDVTVAKLREMGMEEQVAAGPALATQRERDAIKTFDTGPLLLSIELPKGEKFELSVEREEVKGELAFLELGFHGYKQGTDRAAGLDPRILIKMKQETGIWKLADLGFTAHIPLDDPAFLDTIAKELTATRASAAASGAVGALKTLVTAEAIYSISYDRYTCSLAQLGGVEKGGEPSAQRAQLIDASLESGKKAGYLFRLSGCDPAGKKFRAAATPEKPGGGPAYCTDESGVIRKSGDGKATTCFASGQPMD